MARRLSDADWKRPLRPISPLVPHQSHDETLVFRFLTGPHWTTGPSPVQKRRLNDFELDRTPVHSSTVKSVFLRVDVDAIAPLSVSFPSTYHFSFFDNAEDLCPIPRSGR